MTKIVNHFSILIVGIYMYMGISLVKFVSHIFWKHDQYSHKPTSYHTQTIPKRPLYQMVFWWPTLQYLQSFDSLYGLWWLKLSKRLSCHLVKVYMFLFAASLKHLGDFFKLHFATFLVNLYISLPPKTDLRST